ncbi:TPA: hypothetical protein ACHK8E_003530 [Escherichia coli]
MDEVIFTYNEESALTAGQGSFITETGAHIINITEAELKQSEKGARFIEFSGESDDGRKIQYLSVCVQKNDGTENKFGASIIHAMMGCTGIGQLTQHMVSTLKDKDNRSKNVNPNHTDAPGYWQYGSDSF